MVVETLEEKHWSEVKRIYTQGIATGNATFQSEVPEWDQWNAAHVANVRLVAIEEKEVLGWAALTPVSSRAVYSGVGEVSVYIKPELQRKGVGKYLLGKLIELSEHHGFWTLQAGIFPENEGSLKLHKHLGFRIVGIREKIGKMNNEWRDTILLERRSTTIGMT